MLAGLAMLLGAFVLGAPAIVLASAGACVNGKRAGRCLYVWAIALGGVCVLIELALIGFIAYYVYERAFICSSNNVNCPF